MKYFNNIFDPNNPSELYPLAKQSVQIINDNVSLASAILDGLMLPNNTAVYLRGNVNGESYFYIRQNGVGRIALVVATGKATELTLND